MRLGYRDAGTPIYVSRVAAVVRVVDGDTFDLDLDLGFYTTLRVRVRLADIDTWEVYGRNAHPLGPEARDFAEAWLVRRWGEEGHLTVATYKLRPDTPVADAAFGRWLGQVFDRDGASLSDALRNAGYEKLP